VASLLVAFAIDRLVWPDRVVFALYAIPMIVASLRWPLWAVLTAIIATILVAIDDLYASGHATADAAVSLIALLAIGLLATLHTLHRHELQRKIRRQEAVITTVSELRQPLAVILGYAQLLERRSSCEMAVSHALRAIRRAALDLRSMLDEVMDKYAGE
jgi:signal transduction histidine kinase